METNAFILSRSIAYSQLSSNSILVEANGISIYFHNYKMRIARSNVFSTLLTLTLLLGYIHVGSTLISFSKRVSVVKSISSTSFSKIIHEFPSLY